LSRLHPAKGKYLMSTNSSQQSPSNAGKTCSCASKASIFIWAVILLVIGVVLWACFTENGQITMGNIANKGVGNWLLGEGNVQDEQDAATALKQNGVSVVIEEQAGVTSVSLNDCPKPSDETFKNISRLYRLGTLNLAHVEIRDDQLVNFSKLKHLNSLVLFGTPISDAGLVHLVDLQSLRSLFLTHTNITDEGLEQIAKLSNLTNLDISYINMTDNGMKHIAKLKNINWLLLAGNTNITDKGFSELASISELKRLTLSKDMKISKETIQQLQKAIPKLSGGVEFIDPESPAEKPAANITPAAEGEKPSDKAKAQP
jgi:hypothetical protein